MDVKLFAAFWTDIMTVLPGKKAFQKLVYLGQVIGIPFKQPFKMHYFGPYSSSVADELANANIKGIISQVGSSYYFEKGPHADYLIDEHENEIISNIDKLENLIVLFGDMKPLELELYATTHYINNIQRRLYNISSQNDIIAAIKKAKGEKYTVNQIEEAYNNLQEWDLLDSLN